MTATGSAPLSYQWALNNAAIAGATAPTYQTGALTTANSGDVYTVTVSNALGTVASTPATLTVTGIATATLAPSVVILTAQQESTIVSATPSQVVFSGTVDFAEGAIVLGQTHVFKVVSSEINGSQTILSVTEPNLGELFTSLTVQESVTATPEMAVPVQNDSIGER